LIGFWAGRTENKQSQKMTKNRSFSGFFLSKSKIHRKFTFNLFYLHNYKWPILCKIRRVISVKRFSIDRGVTVKVEKSAKERDSYAKRCNLCALFQR